MNIEKPYVRLSLGSLVHVMSSADSEAVLAKMGEIMASCPGQGAPRIEPLSSCEAMSDGGPETVLAPFRAPSATIVDVQPVVHVAELCEDSPDTERTPLPQPSPVFSSFGGELHVDEAAKARIEAQQAALIAGGVPVNAGEQFYATGTRMAVEGYATQEKRHAEHGAKPMLRDAAIALADTVRGEHRQDHELSAREFADALRWDGSTGLLTFGGKKLSEQAIRGLCGRIESPMLGYILGLRERVIGRGVSDATREPNMADKAKIAQVIRHECLTNPSATLKLRTRNSTNNDVFAVVSPSYVPLDAPEIIEQLIEDMPADARGEFSYDPQSTTWELRASIWTPTPVAEQCVGEPFEGFVSYRARDNGTARFRGTGGVLMLRCLNASTYAAETSKSARVHKGRVMFDLEAVTTEAKRAVNVLCEVWGKARAKTIDAPSAVPLSEAIPGFWRYLLTDRRSELAGVLPGRTEHNIKALTSAYYGERRDRSAVTAADLAQGWTKHIQDRALPVRQEAELAIGEWLARGTRVGFEAASA